MKKLISIQIDYDLLCRIKSYCERVGATVSGVIRLAIIKYLENNNG